MILVTGHVIVEEGAIERLRGAMEAQIAASCAEDGCIAYSYSVDVLEPCKIRINEEWESWAALEAHFKQPHMAPWREALKSAGVSKRSIHAYEVDEGREI